MEIKIGSFNCLNFGRESSKKKDISLFSKIIKNEKFDVIALQEIKHPMIVNMIVTQLNCGNGQGKWKGISDNKIGEYAFIWNSEHLTFPRTKLANGNVRVFNPHIYNQYGSDPLLGRIMLKRPPFYGRFQTNFFGLPKVEIRLINTHIRFTKGKDGEELPISVGEVALRKNEFSLLTKNIYYNISDKVYGKSEGEGNPGVAYTFLLGDYNLNMRDSSAGSPYLDSMESIVIKAPKSKNGDKNIITVQKQLTTLKKIVDESDEEGLKFSSNYDHFSFDENRFEGIKYREEAINTVKDYCDNDFKLHLEKVSDHIPIKITLSI